MKYLGTDKDGAPQFEWCCDKAKTATDAISHLDDGDREYDSDKTGFYMIGGCTKQGPGRGKHAIHKIYFCPWCGTKVDD